MSNEQRLQTGDRGPKTEDRDQGPETANSKVVSEVILPVSGHRSSVLGCTRFALSAMRLALKAGCREFRTE